MKLKTFAFIFLIFAVSFSDELRNLTNRGISAYRKGDFATALEIFTLAAEKFPQSNEARFNRGLALGATGNAADAERLLSTVNFENDAQNAEVLFSRARIAEAVGDAAISNEQMPDISKARNSYKTARSLYAQALDLQTDRRARRRTINNIEILSQKIRHLPEEDPNQDEQGDGDDNQDNDENQDNQDGENQQNQNEQDGDDNGDNEQNNDNENQPQNEQNEEDQRRREQEQREQEEKIDDAIRILEHFSDDARELNRPPVQNAVPPSDGRGW